MSKKWKEVFIYAAHKPRFKVDKQYMSKLQDVIGKKWSIDDEIIQRAKELHPHTSADMQTHSKINIRGALNVLNRVIIR